MYNTGTVLPEMATVNYECFPSACVFTLLVVNVHAFYFLSIYTHFTRCQRTLTLLVTKVHSL